MDIATFLEVYKLVHSLARSSVDWKKLATFDKKLQPITDALKQDAKRSSRANTRVGDHASQTAIRSRLNRFLSRHDIDPAHRQQRDVSLNLWLSNYANLNICIRN